MKRKVLLAVGIVVLAVTLTVLAGSERTGAEAVIHLDQTAKVQSIP